MSNPARALVFVAGRAAIRALLTETVDRTQAPDDWRIGTGPQGKPHLAGVHGDRWSIGIAHGAGVSMVGLRDGARFGLDLEPEPVDAREIAEAFGPTEREALARTREDARPFLAAAAWAAKEALFKRSGRLSPQAIDVAEIINSACGRDGEPSAGWRLCRLSGASVWRRGLTIERRTHAVAIAI